MEKKKFDSTKYKMLWAKEHKKQFRVDLNISEYDELCNLLKKKNMTKADFIRQSFEKLKKS